MRARWRPQRPRVWGSVLASEQSERCGRTGERAGDSEVKVSTTQTRASIGHQTSSQWASSGKSLFPSCLSSFSHYLRFSCAPWTPTLTTTRTMSRPPQKTTVKPMPSVQPPSLELSIAGSDVSDSEGPAPKRARTDAPTDGGVPNATSEGTATKQCASLLSSRHVRGQL